MRQKLRVVVLGVFTVGLLACRAAFGQGLGTNELPTLGLSAAERPQFGTRPSGAGFRPSFSPARPGLLRHTGLQDAMQSARNSPLERALAQPPAVSVISTQLDQAIAAMRTMREVRRQQFTARPLRRGRRTRPPAHIARLALAGPPQPDVSVISRRLRKTLKAVGSNTRAVTVRQEGGVTILEGSVASQRARRVTERLLRLEPGVYQVENRLEVSQPERNRMP